MCEKNIVPLLATHQRKQNIQEKCSPSLIMEPQLLYVMLLFFLIILFPPNPKNLGLLWPQAPNPGTNILTFYVRPPRLTQSWFSSVRRFMLAYAHSCTLNFPTCKKLAKVPRE